MIRFKPVILMGLIALQTLGCQRARMTTTKGAGNAYAPVPMEQPQSPSPAEEQSTAQTPQVTKNPEPLPVEPQDEAQTLSEIAAVGMAGTESSKENTEVRAETPARPELVDTNPALDEEVINDAGESAQEFPLRFEPISHKLDILFVLDTSASMDDERAQIAEQMGAFIKELSADVDFRIALLLAHGPRTTEQGVRMGSLFRRPGDAAPLVIQGEAKHQNSEHVISQLREVMSLKLRDRSEAQGEAGLANLFLAVTDSRKIAEMKRAGFLREDAALAVITVSDENDVCYDYKSESKRLGRTIVGRYATDRDRKNELSAFAAGDICHLNGGLVSPERVFAALKKLKGEMPVVTSGIHYLDEEPPTKSDAWAKDNETGRGYLDLISLGFGQSVDLSKIDFGKALAKIGNFANFRMKFDHSFLLSKVEDVRTLKPSSTRVVIRDGRSEHQVPSQFVKLEISEKANRAQVVISYEALANAYEKGLIKADSRLVIYFVNQ